MKTSVIKVYVPPDANLASYPESLDGDMSVFEHHNYEIQWYHYLMLREAGLNVEICRAIPEDGILLIHRRFMTEFVWRPDLYVILLQIDYPRFHRAQMHLVSNHYKTTKRSLSTIDRLMLPGALFCLYPPMHLDLISRETDRGNRFENIVYMGGLKNLDAELQTDSFTHSLNKLGLKLSLIFDTSQHADYSNADAVLAVRKFGVLTDNKPPEKLINAWRAGVPAVLGTELGFREIRRSPEDYIEVDSVADIVESLARLKQDETLRLRMIQNGNMRAEEYSLKNRITQLSVFFESTVFPIYERWENRPRAVRHLWLLVRYIRHLLPKLKIGSWLRKMFGF